MTAPYLDALAALLDKAQAMGDANTRMGTHWDGCEAVHKLCMIDRLGEALPALIARVRELEQWQRDMVEKAAAKSLDGYRELAARAAAAENERDEARARALAMRERCAQACEALKVNRPSDPLANAFDGACETCAAAVRALEP